MQHPTQHGRGPGPGGQRLGAPTNQNTPCAPPPGPAPPLPAPFRISANLSTPGSPRAWAATGWAGLTVLRGGPAPLGLAAPGSPVPPPRTPNSRQKPLAATQPWGGCSGLGRTASVACSSPRSCPRPVPRSPGSPGRRRPSSTRAPAAALPCRQWGTPDGRALGATDAGGGPRPLLSPGPGAEARSWPRPLPTKPRPRGAGTKAEAPPDLHTKDGRPPPATPQDPRPPRVPCWGPAGFPRPSPAVAAA